MRERSKPETEVAPTNMFQASVHPSDKVRSVAHKKRGFDKFKNKKRKDYLGRMRAESSWVREEAMAPTAYLKGESL